MAMGEEGSESKRISREGLERVAQGERRPRKQRKKGGKDPMSSGGGRP